MERAQELLLAGQSIWYDNISRDLIDTGELAKLIEQRGVRGLTSNPTIFEKALGTSNTYDADIRRLKADGNLADDIIEELMLADIGRAADLLHPVYVSSRGEDGYASIEVSPLLAADAKQTISEARRLYHKLNRPNIMIKVPGTDAGIPAIRQLLEEGINVNVTLLFSVENYQKVADCYITALEHRLERGLAVDKISSVASFFVSRVDSVLDPELEALSTSSDIHISTLAKSLIGKCAILNSCLAYLKFLELFTSGRFEILSAAGARVQRPLWASTSTKNPKYRDVIYVESLISANSVNTLPPATLKALIDHAIIESNSLLNYKLEALTFKSKLEDLGLNLDLRLVDLQNQGVNQFVNSFLSLRETISNK